MEFLEKRLEFIASENWDELEKLYGTKYTRDTLQRNSRFLREYIKEGWHICPPNANNSTVNQPEVNSNNIVKQINKDGTQASEGKFDVPVPGMLNDTKYLLMLHGFDPNKFDLVSASSSKWGSESNNQYSSKINVQPKGKEGVIAGEYILSLLGENSKSYEHKSYIKPIINVTSDKILEINVNDFHLGKLCWSGDSLSDFDHNIASDRFNYVITDLISQIKRMNYEYSKIYFVWSNDFFNFDTPAGTTTSGTYLDNSTKWQNMFRLGVELLVWAIDEIVEKLNCIVHTFYIESNHDRQMSYAAINYLYAWYAKDNNVYVDYRCRGRKYIEFGNTMIGYCHGDIDGKKINKLMALEEPEMFGRTKFRYMNAGHYHSSQSRPYTEDFGCEVRYLSTLTPEDYWHYANGYIGSIKCGYAFIYDKTYGRQIEIRSNILENDRRLK